MFAPFVFCASFSQYITGAEYRPAVPGDITLALGANENVAGVVVQ
jgi:hypothetical protein